MSILTPLLHSEIAEAIFRRIGEIYRTLNYIKVTCLHKGDKQG